MTNRLSTLMHHVITLCRPDELGTTKLAKMLWFADVEHYRRTGQTITGMDDYRKEEQGPLHRQFYQALDALKAEGAIAISWNPTPVGPRREFFSQSLPDLSCFTAEEIATVDRVVCRIKPMSAKQISIETHDALWNETPWSAKIAVSAGAVFEGEIEPDLASWAEAELDRDAHSATA